MKVRNHLPKLDIWNQLINTSDESPDKTAKKDSADHTASKKMKARNTVNRQSASPKGSDYKKGKADQTARKEPTAQTASKQKSTDQTATKAV